MNDIQAKRNIIDKKQAKLFEQEILSFLPKFMKKNFGKGPAFVHVKIQEDILYVSIKGFIFQPIKALLNNKENIEFVKIFFKKLYHIKRKESLEKVYEIIRREVEVLSIKIDFLDDSCEIVGKIK